MKNWHFILGVAAICLSCHFSVTQASKMALVEENKRITVENERLRSFNTRKVRRLHFMSRPEKIDPESVALATHILAIPPSVISALLFCENGPQDLETGSIDKTDYFALHFPVNRWSALDGSRTLNRLLWAWFLTLDQESQIAFYLYAAKPYTAGSKTEQKQWATNLLTAERRFRDQIKSEKQVPLLQPMRTPQH